MSTIDDNGDKDEPMETDENVDVNKDKSKDSLESNDTTISSTTTEDHIPKTAAQVRPPNGREHPNCRSGSFRFRCCQS